MSEGKQVCPFPHALIGAAVVALDVLMLMCVCVYACLRACFLCTVTVRVLGWSKHLHHYRFNPSVVFGSEVGGEVQIFD